MQDLSPSNSPDTTLQADNLACERDDRTLFSGLSFQLRPHQVLLVEGQNGSGKTTLLRILCGIRRQDNGEVNWSGQPIEQLGQVYREQLAYVGHRDGIKDYLTVAENLRMSQALGQASQTSIDGALQQVNLYDREDLLTHNLSAGQRRRLALARLLVTDAPLWILDEPFTALDKAGVLLFEALMQKHTEKGGMVVLTSHHEVNLDSVEVQRLTISA